MALNIIKSSQPLLVESIIFYLYTDPGIGKSTLAHTAEKPVVFDFDKGSHRVGNKLRRGDVVPVRQWSDVASMVGSDLAEFKTIVCDTVGAMLDCIKTHLSNNSENRQRDGSLTIKAQGLANNMFMQTINKWISYGKDVVFIAHAVEEESGKDKIKVFRPDLGGKNRNMLYRMADVMGYMNSNTNAEGVMERIINFCPSPTHHAKNSGNLNEVLVPDMEFDATFLARLIQQSKDYINSMTPEQIAETKSLADLNNFKQNCEEAKYASDLNQLTESLDREHKYVKEMWHAVQIQAKTLKCTLNKENKRWSNPPDFRGINDQQRDELQNLLDQAELDVMTFCEDQGIESLMAIEASKFNDVKAHIINTTQGQGAAIA